MDATLVALRNTLAGALQAVAAKTEGLYLSLSATYPEMVREMRQSLGQTAGLLDDNGCSDDASNGASNGACLMKMIQGTRGLVDELSVEFEESYAKDMEIFTLIGANIDDIKGLGAHIHQIREDSIAMELISLNAMTVALKAGSSGRAFSYITEELKRLSARTIELTQTVTNQGENLLKLFGQFSNRLQTGAAMEKDIFGGFKERIHSSYDGFSEGIREITMTLDGLRGRTDQIFNPLMRIMEEIQKQDLIRQSIDHIIISLDEIRAIHDDSDVETLLDEYSFLKTLPQLCLGVLKEIRGMVVESETVFREQLRLAQDNMDRVEAEREHFIKMKLADRSEGSMEYNFLQSEKILEQLFKDLEGVFQHKRQTVEGSRDLTRKVRDLDETFKNFSGLTTRFHTIDVASRIEIAKQEVLKQMAGTVDEMTRLTAQIEGDVDQSLQVTSQFLDNVHRGFDSYRKLSASQEQMAQRSTEKLRRRHKSLVESRDRLIDSIAGFRVFTDVFVEKFRQSSQELGQITVLLGEMDAIQRKLQDVMTEAEEGFQNVLHRSGRTTWQLRDERLKKVIERFTIFSHKKIAADLAGFEVETGVQAGDVTLF